jgi:hypothetical protein
MNERAVSSRHPATVKFTLPETIPPEDRDSLAGSTRGRLRAQMTWHMEMQAQKRLSDACGLQSLRRIGGDPFAPSWLSRRNVALEKILSMSHEPDPSPSRGMGIDRGPERAYEAYQEGAFRHFLTLERKRAERSGRSMLLMLVEFKASPNGDGLLDAAMASRLFAALSGCVREIDFIGWYRTGRVAGAVLTQGPDAPDQDVSQQIGERVAQVLSERLPVQVRHRIQVRILQLHSTVKN